MKIYECAYSELQVLMLQVSVFLAV